jgi:hypothetical protein
MADDRSEVLQSKAITPSGKRALHLLSKFLVLRG